MDLVLWNVKGYAGIQLTKEKLQSEKYTFEEIKKNVPNIIKQIEDNLEKGGIVFCLTKKKIIKAIYIFKLTTVNKEKILVFENKVILDEVNKCIKEFEKALKTILNSIIFNRHDIDKAVWKEKEINKSKKIKSAITGVKTITWLGMIMYCMMFLATIIGSASYFFLASSKYSIEEIKNNEAIINYVSDINNYSYGETIEVLSSIDDNVSFVVVEIIIPTVFNLIGYILIIISLKEILALTKNVIDNKSLFTEDKNRLLKKIIIQTYIALLFIIDNFILWLGIGIILEIMQYMFNYCVQLTKDKK